METPDWTAIGSGIGAGVMAVFAKMGVDKVRGNGHSGVQKELEAHKKDDLDKFGAMTQALKDVAKAQTDSQLELVREIGVVARSVGRVEGQLDVIAQALKKD